MSSDRSQGSLTERLLRASACVALDARAIDEIRQACAAQRDWDRTICQAEQHGLAPYLRMQLDRASANVPPEYRKKLNALASRHAQSNKIRTRALLEIVERLDHDGVEVLALKGAALAHLIYEHPGLRPMSDIDLLVTPADRHRAAALISELGYRRIGDQGLLRDHHHLPTIARTTEGLCISIEVHHDALAPDNIGSIRLGALTEPPREFSIEATPVRALGHIDTLRHLCRHTLEPRETTKLGSALDIMRYASRYRDAIDWLRMQREFPEVITMIQLLGYLLPWPRCLDGVIRAPPPSGAPKHVGVGMIPLSRLRRHPNWAAKLLNPSDWWLRAFYNVPPGRSLLFAKTVYHPGRVAYWLWRRRGRTLH